MNRRTFLKASTAGGLSLGIAGCLNGSSPNVKQVESLPTPTIGAAESDVLIQVFEDYMCPHCAKFDTEIFPPLKKNYIDTEAITYEFHDFPIPVGELSYPAAIAARSVQDNVGEDAFWTFKKRVFTNQSIMTKQKLVDYAVDLGMDEAAIREDINGEVYRPVVEADKEKGTSMGVRGTPYVFVNGEYLKNPTYTRLADQIESIKQ